MMKTCMWERLAYDENMHVGRLACDEDMHVGGLACDENMNLGRLACDENMNGGGWPVMKTCMGRVGL